MTNPEVGAFVEFLEKERNDSPHTVKAYGRDLAGLNEQDIDLVSDQLKVRGKGKKERIVPVGRHAGRALRRYYRLRDAVLAATGQERRAVFVSGRGKRLTPRSVQLAIKRLLVGLAGRRGAAAGAGAGNPHGDAPGPTAAAPQ